jgi:hypothetical protein
MRVRQIESELVLAPLGTDPGIVMHSLRSRVQFKSSQTRLTISLNPTALIQVRTCAGYITS